jgi:hypothetical protein
MDILSTEEFELKAAPLFNRGLTEIVTIIKKHDHRFVSQKYDYLKIVSNPYSTWFDIEPLKLQQALANASNLMGDDFIYLSFLGYMAEPDVPMHFKFPVEELLVKDVSELKGEAEKYTGEIYLSNFLIYSSQGLWATLLQMDCYGTIGMTKDFLTVVRSIYPQLDEELDTQLFNFIRWCNYNSYEPDEWKYTPGDNTGCTGWCRGLMEYLCRRKITPEDEKLDDDVDLIAIYRNIKV